MVYEFIGRIIAVFEREGNGQKGPWKMHEAVIEHDTTGQYPRRVLVSVWDENVWATMATIYNNGNSGVIKVAASVDCREFNGRWFNDIRVFRAEPFAAQMQQPQTCYAAPAPVAPMQQPAPSARNAANAGVAGGNQQQGPDVFMGGGVNQPSDLPF